MDLQTVVLILALIFFASWIIILGIVAFVAYKVQRFVKELPQRAEAKAASFFSSNKTQIMTTIALPIATTILGKIKNKIFSEKKKS